ncbi:MAG: ATP-binding protein, partial [Myxococcota bacterium]
DSRADREGLSLEVEDTGIGIAPERLEAIFEPFHTSVGGSAGSGIGLTVSRAFVERLGGTLTVRSEPGVGSTFTVWLPERHDGAELFSDGVDPVD